MRSWFVFALLATTIVANMDAVGNKDFKFQLLDPHGYRVSFKPMIEVTAVTLHGVINEKHSDPADCSTLVNPGYVAYSRVHIDVPNNKSYSTAMRTYVVPQGPRVPAN